jgi:ParB family chromosome partitioning protein
MPSTAKATAKKKQQKSTTAAKPLPLSSIPVEKIDPSPLNREATVELAPLIESIREHGLQQPIKLRPRGARYEIVYGERRWRSCRKLGHETILATVEDLTDDEAHEIRILENAQRQDPHALEEAEAYERLLAMKDSKGNPIHTPDSVAKLAGRSIGHVYNRLKLTDLHPELRKVLYKDELTLSSAFVIARGVPTALQPEAWKKMQEYREEAYDEEIDDRGRLTTKMIQAIIESDYSNRLDLAPFSLKDEKLVAAAGACQSCPKRSGNQPQLFTEAEPKDVCTDLRCYQQKVAAYVAREKERALAIGGAFLGEDESRRLFNGGSTLPYNSRWVNLDAVCFDDPERRTWRALLGDLCPAPTLAFTAQSKPVLLAEKASILATLKAHGLDPASLRSKAVPVKKSVAASTALSTGNATSESIQRHHDDPEDDLEDDAVDDEDLDRVEELPAGTADVAPDQRLEGEITRVSRQRILAAVVAAAESAPMDDNRFAQLVYETMLQGGYHNAVTEIVKRRIGSKRPKGEHVTTTLEAHGASLGAAALRALVLELAIARSAFYIAADAKYPRTVARAIELYGIDAMSIEKTVSEELRARRAARRAKATGGA